MAKERQSNIELLRVFAMAGVIFLHYFNAGIGGAIKFVAKGTPSETLLMILESVNICAVNLFVMISGYFLSRDNKRSVGNAIALFLQTSIFRMVYYAIQAAIKHAHIVPKTMFRMFLPANWFIVLYVAMYLVSPLINHALASVKKKRAMLVVLLLFSLWPTLVDVLQHIMDVDLNSLSTLGMYGSERGYTITNFLMCYMLGACLNDVDLSKIKRLPVILLLVLNVALITVWSYWDASSAREYCNPLVVASAVGLVLLFLSIDLGTKPWINRLAGAAFSVYLLHTWFFPLLQIETYVKSSFFVMVAHIVLSILAIIAVSFIIDNIYKLLFGPLNKKLKGVLVY